jgi:hypothetical protein
LLFICTRFCIREFAGSKVKIVIKTRFESLDESELVEFADEIEIADFDQGYMEIYLTVILKQPGKIKKVQLSDKISQENLRSFVTAKEYFGQIPFEVSLKAIEIGMRLSDVNDVVDAIEFCDCRYLRAHHVKLVQNV